MAGGGGEGGGLLFGGVFLWLLLRRRLSRLSMQFAVLMLVLRPSVMFSRQVVCGRGENLDIDCGVGEKEKYKSSPPGS